MISSKCRDRDSVIEGEGKKTTKRKQSVSESKRGMESESKRERERSARAKCESWRGESVLLLLMGEHTSGCVCTIGPSMIPSVSVDYSSNPCEMMYACSSLQLVSWPSASRLMIASCAANSALYSGPR